MCMKIISSLNRRSGALGRSIRNLLIIATLSCSLIATAKAEVEEVWDPLEPVNRGIFAFNDVVDVNVFEPLARGYEYALPGAARRGIGHFFENLSYPSLLVSDVLQFKFGQAVNHTGRFLVNTTVGVAGFMDVASDWGLKPHNEDIGITMAYYGVPAGPYIVIPFLGPSNLRDVTGRVVDGFLDPFNWVAFTNASGDVRLWVPVGARIMKGIHQRSLLLEDIQTAKQSSLDYYLSVQSAFYQYRHGVLTDGRDRDEE